MKLRMVHIGGNREKVKGIMNYFLWTIGVFMLFAGMCMQECEGNTFILQLSLVVVGSLIAFAGYIREELKNERELRDKRIAEMKRRMRDAS